MQTRQPMSRTEDQAGFAALGMVVMLVSVLFVVGSYLHTMSGRNSRLQLEVGEERALMAAEAGIDVVQYRARTAPLTNGQVFEENLPGGGAFRAVITNLGTDGFNNDGDLETDEADENVFQVVSTGTHGTNRRRIAAYLGFSTFVPNVTAAAVIMNPSINLVIGGVAEVNGNNHNLGGGLSGSGNVHGLCITEPGTTANLLTTLSPAEQGKIAGLGGTPSLGTTPAFTLNTLLTEAANSAHIVVTNSVVASPNYGNPTTGPQYIVYRNGNVRFTGNGGGAGLLVVTGDLTISGTFNWYGVVVVLGRLDAGAGTANIRGGVILGPNCSLLDIRGTCDLEFSAAAVALATNLTGRYVAFNGWQEISTN